MIRTIKTQVEESILMQGMCLSPVLQYHGRRGAYTFTHLVFYEKNNKKKGKLQI